MNSKKIIFSILIAAAVLGAFFGVFGVKQASAAFYCCNSLEQASPCPAGQVSPIYYCNNPAGGLPIPQCVPCPGAAQGGMGEYGKTDNPNGTCNPFNFNAGNCILSMATNAAQYLIWTPASWFMALGGMTLDFGIEFSINSSLFRDLATGETSAVTAGWTIARDIVNLFLIFILLYIAIATILQISRYGAKQLLITLIIVAFLVNFSLVATRLIIDASNILTTGFYEKLTEGGQTISSIFKIAFDADAIVTADEAVKDFNPSIILSTYLFGAVIMAIAGFIFLVFGFLFIIRMVVLLILMVFAPLAFAAMILPSTQNYARQWWSSLLNQSFFAPAALFMLYWAAMVANSGFIKNALSLAGLNIPTTAPSAADMIKAAQANDAASWTGIFGYAIQFFIIAVILCASLVIAKMMGAYGAQTAIAQGQRARNAIQGYAGRAAKRTAIARPARLLKESKTMQKLTTIPILGRFIGRPAMTGLEKAAKAGGLEEIAKRRVELGRRLSPQYQEDYFNRLDRRSSEAWLMQSSPSEQARLRSKGKPQTQQKIDGIIEGLESRIGKEGVIETKTKMAMAMPTEKDRSAYFGTQNPETQAEIFKQVSARERVEILKALALTTASATALMAALPTEEQEKTKKTEKEVKRQEAIKNLTIDQSTVSTTEFTTAIQLAKPEEMPNLDKSIALDPIKIDEILKFISGAHLQKIDDRGDDLSDAVIDALYKLDTTGTKNAKNIIAALRAPAINNQRLARNLETGPMRTRFGLT